MAYESSIPFADIREFREAEINGIPALFTMCRLDSETLPADFHSCEGAVGAAISSGSFRWLLQTSPELSSPGSPSFRQDRHTPKYAGMASTM